LNQEKNWWEFISIDETRVSVLVALLIVTSIFALVMYYLHGDFSSNLLSFLISLVTAVGGINVADKVSSFLNKSSR